MRLPKSLSVVLAIIALSPVSAAWGEGPYPVAWIRQLGTPSDEWGTGVSADRVGNVYVTGSTRGALGGPSAGGEDIFLSKYSASGNLLWSRQLGTPSEEASYAVSADALGNVYVGGYTDGSLGGPNAGGEDAFLGKYDANGNLQWLRQFGTRAYEDCYSVSPDGLGNVYVSGHTTGDLGGPPAGQKDAFLGKYDADGNLLWMRQFGTEGNERGYGVSADGRGDVYIAGYTSGPLVNPEGHGVDAFLGKYDELGNLVWMCQFGALAPATARGVSADGVYGVYVSGETLGSLGGPNAGAADAFLSKYDIEGNPLWARQLGTAGEDGSRAVSADGLGNVYISGHTRGSLAEPNAGDNDVFVSKYDAEGNLLWTRQIGTTAADLSYGVSADGLGNVYLTGYTRGSLGGPNAGAYDVFLIKLSIPEPHHLAILSICAMALRRRRQGGDRRPPQ